MPQRPNQPYTFKEIKEHLQAQPPIHFKGLSRDDIGKRLTHLLDNFFVYNGKFETVYDNGKVQTNRNKRRSLGDIYRICYYYFPNITLTHIYRHLLKMIGDGKALSAICQATKMRVYRNTDGYEKHYFNGDPIDEFQVDIKFFEEYGSVHQAKDYWGYGWGKEKLNLVDIKQPVKP